MEHTHTVEGHEHQEHEGSTKTIWKTFWILLCVTVVEVALAFLHLETGFPSRLVLNAIFVGLTIVKAFFIVAEFMHLRHEIKNLILTILIPLMLFVWFIIAFLADGDSWKNMRKDLSPGAPRQELPAVHTEEGHH
ncbi:Cytochrome c oxidase subunit IV [Chitinophaga rupis]|uniref:Cytochrome c oxidase subunit IV n=1 Tax=Chitinophaga rupis TaxID=573321 RepID=A0A1H7J2G5_9BACT|nr:cytochrome C oxidase subunit IV family protein [Chitinophaga rupis]SEK67315.1 Cytochrome c oxidase subunit IV [Chitinophaga rupis]